VTGDGFPPGSAAGGDAPPPLAYALGNVEAGRRAAIVTAVGAATALAPLVLACELLVRLRWSPPPAFWAVAVAVFVLVVTRASVQLGQARRRLRSLRITMDGDAIATHTARGVVSIARAEVDRIVEIEGPLGGLRVTSHADARGATRVVNVPRGGDGFGDVRAQLERWGAVERRGRRGPLVRVGVGLAVVAAVFFLPFLLEDVVARSPAIAGVLVAATWAAMRWALRGR
jgi:hypothetical protein